MSRHVGQAKKKQDERANKQRTRLEQLVSSISGQTQKFANEWGEKHNKLGQVVDSFIKATTTEVGRVWATIQQIVGSIDHMDVNTLANAHLNKVLFGKMAVFEARMKALEMLAEIVAMSDEEKSKLLEAGTGDYTEEIKAAFTFVLEERKRQDEAKKAAAELAKKQAEEAAAAKAEAERAEQALREAEQPGQIETLGQGGKGSEIPEGAEVFGGA